MMTAKDPNDMATDYAKLTLSGEDDDVGLIQQDIQRDIAPANQQFQLLGRLVTHKPVKFSFFHDTIAGGMETRNGN